MNFFVKIFLLILPSCILAMYAYYGALFFFWSKYKESPFGYETCGLESIVWMGIFPIFIISIFFKFLLVRVYNFKKNFLILPIISLLFFIAFCRFKDWLLGAFCICFAIVEMILIFYFSIKSKKL